MPHLRRVTVLGASGSIGQQTLSLLAAYPGCYRVEGLSVHRNIEYLRACLERFQPAWVAVTEASAYAALRKEWEAPCPLLNTEGLFERLATDPGDIVVNGIVGAAGFWASWYTLEHPTALLALANKESLVFGGAWLAAQRHRILPVDSEHSAIFQCLQGERGENIESLILTASGGPFRGQKKAELATVSPSQALRHPVWRMGHRITIDSATLMNKALELIEAYWLFSVPESRIEVWVHPECIVHSLVLFRDGAMKAQLSLPDMRLPILYALSYPARLSFAEGRWDPLWPSCLRFEAVDEETFPSVGFAREALRRGGAAPALLNAADELAVEAFLAEAIGFLEIFRWVEWALAQPEANLKPSSPQELLEIEKAFREKMRRELSQKAHASRGGFH